MHYPTVSSIYQEIAELVPLYKAAKDNEPAQGVTQWQLPKDGKFSFSDSLDRPKLSELKASEIMEALSS